MSCRIEPNTELERGAGGGQTPSSLEETNFFSEQGKHRCIILLYVLLYNIYFMYMIVHLRTGVGWNIVALGLFPLQRYLVYPTMDLER
jgi:hypothetical protein